MAGASIALTQCSFEIDLSTGVVLFIDRSFEQSCQVFGHNVIPFEYGHPRQVVVQEGVNQLIGMGGVKRNLIRFVLHWHDKPALSMEKVRNRRNFALQVHPRLAGTIQYMDVDGDEDGSEIPDVDADGDVNMDSTLPSRWETRGNTARSKQLGLRYAQFDDLGSGNFGTVCKAVDIKSGKLMAVKTLKRPPNMPEWEWKTLLQGKLRREVDILAQSEHVSNISSKSSVCPGTGSKKRKNISTNMNASRTLSTSLHRMAGRKAWWR